MRPVAPSATNPGAELLDGPVLRTVGELGPGAVPEAVRRVRTARTVFVNHALLQHDFPELRDEVSGQAGPEGGEPLAVWLRENAAFVSSRQAEQSQVNTPIEMTDETSVGFRPPAYGRALVFSLEEHSRRRGEAAGGAEGLLDVKGTGVGPRAGPSNKPHRNGLLALGEAFREVAFEGALNRIFQHAGSGCRTVPIYGVIDLGFDLELPGGVRVPAGLLVRRAHGRPRHPEGLKPASSPLVRVEVEIERLLRRYGVTTAGPSKTITLAEQDGALTVHYGPAPLRYDPGNLERIRRLTGFRGGVARFEGINVQLTREAETDPSRTQVVDLGGFTVASRFEHPFVSLVATEILRLGEIFRPEDPRFVQPDERIRLPYELWGKTGEIQGLRASGAEAAFFHMDNPQILGFHLARELRAGNLSGGEVRQRLGAYVEASTSWPG